MNIPKRQVRAVYDTEAITVYQAYPLGIAALSHFDRRLHDDAAAWAAQKAASPVRVQWDPERTPSGAALEHRSLQVGIGGAAVDAYVDEWVIGLEDITERVRAWRSELVDGGSPTLPHETPYPLPSSVAVRIEAHTALRADHAQGRSDGERVPDEP
ncbi:DUF4291 family protein [Promicromonospora iranensis]|uniref:DUF4291 family protein n=1 Tax=Promicromonospora iranensis TaxID=1105144 RepID=A0ABU2CI11_9MICO|nr:DUF4291 family protein [Promicromonospora iranensis]MDR7380947.1 hypothetical protein [Promicromonospora iranensis]